MNDRFRFRVPVIKNNEFDGFVYINLGEKLPELHGGHYGMAEQCTGLKDKNGKLIYEGDIVQMSYPYYPQNKYLVKWGDCCWELWLKNGFVYVIYEKMSLSMEVIGNIHENADLLGDKTDEI